ncbi:hypothetical protein BDSB_18105 [Burkholderia dolosa PC543]|nr:hypothetical protein BDSB_18105 [Burkholderia dolosa PC543]
MLEQIICDERQVVSSRRKVLGISFFLARACVGNMKIGNMPIFDHHSECAGRLEPFELAQSLDCQNVRRIELLLLPIQGLVGLGEILFIRNCIAPPIREIEKSKRRTITTSFVAQYFTRHYSTPGFIRLNF